MQASGGGCVVYPVEAGNDGMCVVNWQRSSGPSIQKVLSRESVKVSVGRRVLCLMRHRYIVTNALAR
jgi:hypothetical protein